MTQPAPITLRLFKQLQPTEEIGRRTLSEGETAIGRDPEADWVIPDPTKTLSRRHCVIALQGGAVTLRDESVNGVLLGDGQRPPMGMPVPLRSGDTVALGAFLIRIEAAADQPQPLATTAVHTRLQEPLAENAAAGEGPRQGQLLDAFCSGAQIDASVFSGEDLQEVMHRLGAVYRQMVVGLSELMNERTGVRTRYGLERTTVQAADNNPFRWAPPQRVAVDLLQSGQDGFLTSETAVQSSFEDLRLHHKALASGLRPAVGAILNDLSPGAAAERLRGKSFLIKNRTSALWAEYVQIHAQLSEDLQETADGSAGRAFREAYERTVADSS